MKGNYIMQLTECLEGNRFPWSFQLSDAHCRILVQECHRPCWPVFQKNSCTSFGVGKIKLSTEQTAKKLTDQGTYGCVRISPPKLFLGKTTQGLLLQS